MLFEGRDQESIHDMVGLNVEYRCVRTCKFCEMDEELSLLRCESRASESDNDVTDLMKLVLRQQIRLSKADAV